MEEFQVINAEGTREVENHSSNCHRQDPSMDAEIGGWKIKRKQDVRSLKVSPSKQWVILKGK